MSRPKRSGSGRTPGARRPEPAGRRPAASKDGRAGGAIRGAKGSGSGRGPQRGAGSEGRESAPDSRYRWVVGLHSVEEVFTVRPQSIRHLWLREDWERSQSLSALAERAASQRIRPEFKSAGQLDRVAPGHQGVVVAVDQTPEWNWDELEGPGPHVVLILDGIEDPQNLGAILRTAWLTSVKGVLIPQVRAVGLTPTVCKVASGGAEHVPVEECANFAPYVERLRKAGFWIYGLSEKSERRPWEFQLPEKVAWAVGSEGQGLRVTTERMCDELVRIPQVASGSSYNASIALAMALAETCRQSGKPE